MKAFRTEAKCQTTALVELQSDAHQQMSIALRLGYRRPVFLLDHDSLKNFFTCPLSVMDFSQALKPTLAPELVQQISQYIRKCSSIISKLNVTLEISQPKLQDRFAKSIMLGLFAISELEINIEDFPTALFG